MEQVVEVLEQLQDAKKTEKKTSLGSAAAGARRGARPVRAVAQSAFGALWPRVCDGRWFLTAAGSRIRGVVAGSCARGGRRLGGCGPSAGTQAAEAAAGKRSSSGMKLYISWLLHLLTFLHNDAFDLKCPDIERTDHYLGKELVENLSVLSFYNLIYEPLEFPHPVTPVARSTPHRAAAVAAQPSPRAPPSSGVAHRPRWPPPASQARRGAAPLAPRPVAPTRAEVRAQARRHIGDTSLLDHLLRHIADKVPAVSGERVRRRYNPTGGLEYWLAATRREGGVDDPFWLKTSGWKPGDLVSPEARALEVQKQVEELAWELDVVKGGMTMVKANGKLDNRCCPWRRSMRTRQQVNGELKGLLLLLKDKYETVLEKNDKLEEQQMVTLSTSFQSMKEDLLLQRIGEQPMLMLAREPWDADKQEASAGNAAGGAGNQLVDAAPSMAASAAMCFFI
ncbi:hypothetical protein C2845_PM03G31900 [Panicum miliaceum]|uniref:PTC1-like winged helix-turn-helix domain-containing protein n=1 Tax=Panicum miliaceum TaxID=4540 RepID=A0A3L6TFN1_PANMI|nr:hypothetical protein C2845_PM03G31900 [Panicum miliaceum]